MPKAIPANSERRSSPRLVSRNASKENLNSPLTKSAKLRLAEAFQPVKQNPSLVSVKCPFSIARQEFHRSAEVRLVGREKERMTIHEYLNSNDTRALYVCGTPGTGKTAFVSAEIKGPVINCVSDREFFDGLTRHVPGISKENVLIMRPTSGCFAFDEVDQLAERHPRLFRMLLEWPREGVVKVICVANTLDLTIKHLPGDVRVNILRFEPYGVEDISLILADRLARCNEALRLQGVSLVQPQAIELCARKIAATGDLRKAFEIMGKAISLAQEEASNHASGDYLANLEAYFKANTSLQASSCLINFAHVAKAIEQTINRSTLLGHNVRSAVVELNLHQKIFLIALCLLTRLPTSLPRTRVTVANLYEKYLSLVKGIVEPLAKHDCLELASHLETLRLLALTKDTAGKISSPVTGGKRARKGLAVADWSDAASLCLSREELEQAIGDSSTILKSLLCE